MERDEDDQFASNEFVSGLSQWVESINAEPDLSSPSRSEEDSISDFLKDLQKGEQRFEEEFATFLPQKPQQELVGKEFAESKSFPNPINNDADVDPSPNEMELAEYFYRNTLSKKFLLLWRFMTSYKIEFRHQMKLAQDFRNLMLKGQYLRHWRNHLLQVKNTKLEHKREIEKMALESYKGKLLMKAFSSWRLFVVRSKSKKANDALALQRWALSIESKAFQAWKLYCSRYKEKRKREADAKKLYKDRLIQKGISQWIKFGLEKQHKRDSLLLQRELRKRERIFLLVAKIARKWKSKALESRVKRGNTSGITTSIKDNKKEPRILYPVSSPFLGNIYNSSTPTIINTYIPPFKTTRTTPVIPTTIAPTTMKALSTKEPAANNRKPPKVPFSVLPSQKPPDTLPLPTSSREQILQKLRVLANATSSTLNDTQKNLHATEFVETKTKVETANIPSSKNSSFRSETTNISSDVDAEMYAIEKRLREIGQEKHKAAQAKLEYEQLIQMLQIQKNQIQLNPKNEQLPKTVHENERRAKELLKEINDFQANKQAQVEEIKQLQARIQELKRYT